MQILGRRSPNTSRIERWLGKDRVEEFARLMEGWYGSPICLQDVPGSLWVGRDGEFSGTFERGAFSSAADAFASHLRDLWKRAGRPIYQREGLLGAGFASISDALARGSQGYGQSIAVAKVGPTGVSNVCSSLWRVGVTPAAGGAASAAPGGRACTDATTGAMPLTNPASGTLHLIGADMSCSTINNGALIYDRIFDVAKTMNSTATEAVTGVPTRYQSSTATDPDYAGNNFLFVEVGGTALAATAHNWTTCLYRNQAGTDNQTLPSLTGASGGIVDRLDHPSNSWFAPLASGDTGIMDLAQMQCSAAVATGAVNFVIGHPLGWMAFPVINSILPFDWLTNRNLAPRVFDDACLAMIEAPKPNTTSATYTGQIYLLNAAA